MKFSRILFLGILIGFATISLNAQNHPFFIGMRYGYSLPVGQFSSHQLKKDGEDYGGYALLGSTFSAEGGWYFIKKVSIAFEVSMAYFPLASGYYLQDLQADTTDPSVEYLYLKSDPYEVRNYMLGVEYRLPSYKKFSFTLKGMGGLCWAKTPYQFYTGQYLIGNLFHVVTPAISKSYSFLLGANIDYHLFDHVDLVLASEFSFSNSSFIFWKDGATRKVTRDMRIPVVRIQPGLTLTF